MKKLLGVILLTCVLTLVFGEIAIAAILGPTGVPGPGPGAGEAPPTKYFGGKIPTTVTSGAGFLSLIENTTDWIFSIILVFSVIMIVLAGWQFISAGGDALAVTQAKNKLIYAVIGIIVAFLARAVPAAIADLFGAS